MPEPSTSPSEPRTPSWLAELTLPVRVPARRLVDTVRTYNAADLRGDLVAGATVAVVAVPQSMAYAIIAGVPAVYGLYTFIIQCAIGSLLNSQKFLSVGPINTQSLLTASIITSIGMRVAEPGMSEQDMGGLFISLAVTLTFVKGLMQVLLSAARLGALVRYVSQSVIVGFTAGAGVLIAAGQVPAFLGYQANRSADDLPALVGTIQRTVRGLDGADWRSVVLGVIALAVVVGGRRVSKLFPGPLLAVALGAVTVWLVGFGAGDFRLVGEIPQGLPAPSLPDVGRYLEQSEAIFAGALALSLLGVMEAYSIGKSIASKTGDRISANVEMFSQGATNFLSSFFMCIPGSGSFSRSALNFEAGARTVLSGVFNALFVLVIFLIGAPAAKYVPMSAIAAILFVIAFGLIDWSYLLRAWRSSRSDAITCLGTFVATLVAPLQYAVFIGVFLNLAVYLRRASELRMIEMVSSPQGPFLEREVHEKAGGPRVRFLQVEGNLFFGQADELQDRLDAVGRSGVKVVVLRLKRCHSMDSTIMQAIERFVQQMKGRGGYVVLCGVRPELMGRLRGFGLVRDIGEENVFATREGVFTSAKAALRRAKALVGASIDEDVIADEDERGDGWAWQI